MNNLKIPLLIGCLSICCSSLATTLNNKTDFRTQQKQIQKTLNSNNFQYNQSNVIKYGKNCPTDLQKYVFTRQKDIDDFPQKCKSVPQLIITGNDIKNLDGLKNIQKVTNYPGNQISIMIGGPKYSNPSLQQLSGLNHLRSVNGYIDIFGNKSLRRINAFQNLKKINGQLIISQNPALTSIKALPLLSSLESLTIAGNHSLKNVIGEFGKLTNIPEDLSIEYNNLSSLSFLKNITTVGLLSLSDNNGLTSLDGLQNIKKLTRDKSKKYNAYFENQNSLKDCSQISKLYHAIPSRFFYYNLNPVCERTLTN